jgi:hypothetical protein
MRYIFALKKDMPTVRKLETGNEAKQGCLAAAGRPKQCKEFVLGYRQRNVIQRLHWRVTCGFVDFRNRSRLNRWPHRNPS